MATKPKPAGSRWTDEQWQAIASGGENILVAASAGSGKTAVLVERIIQKLTDPAHAIDVDRLLIVTFTNAAAAEMRQRIGEALEEALHKQPESQHLRRQLSLLNRAMICTLHAFCLSVVRQHYYLVDVDPDFRLSNETEAELLQDEVLEALLEEEYARSDNEDFFALIDGYTSDRSDAALAELIIKIYQFSRSHPEPNEWLKQLVKHYEIDEDSIVDELTWGKELLQAIHLELDGCRALLELALERCQAPGGPEPYAERIQSELNQVDELRAIHSWGALSEAFQSVHFGRLKQVRGDEYDLALRDQARDARNEAKEKVEKLAEQFSRPTEEWLADIRRQAPLVRKLVDLVQSFGERYWKAKEARGLVDFSDLEHFTLQILGATQPSTVAGEFRQLFEEVLVDEYQDTNLVQEAILKLITRGDNLFMVGDVKQSIYRFRLAEPGLFLHKYKTYLPTPEHGKGLRIDLARNFRSRWEVLEATNYLFKQLMDEQIAEMEYDELAELKPGARYPEREDTEVDVLVINRGDPLPQEGATEAGGEGESEESAEEELETAQLEGRLVARRIKEMINEKRQVVDRETGQMRPMTYRDIVILMRSMPWATQVLEELKQAGIPVYAELSSGYFEATEVSTMISLLQVIDNPDQDIPLAGVLRSPIVGLTENELAQVRLAQKDGSFFEAFKAACQTLKDENLKERLLTFYDQLQGWRMQARQIPLPELIWQLFRETGYYAFVGGLPGGKQRQANLRALYDRARSYEATSFRGLFGFLRFIERLRERGDDLGTARALGEQEDVVRMMTIHKSKGLEFPVVFIIGLGKQFNMRDLSHPVLLHKELGLGMQFVDTSLRLSYPALPQLAIKSRLKVEMLAEEMRVLYVALTRAKEKLYLIGSVRDAQATMDRWGEVRNDQWLLPAYKRIGAASYLDWIGPVLLRHENLRWQGEADEKSLGIGRSPKLLKHSSRWSFTMIERSHLIQDRTEEAAEPDESVWSAVKAGQPVNVTSDGQGTVVRQLSWQYPHRLASRQRSKLSVSEIKRAWQAADPYTEPYQADQFRSLTAERPRFMQEKKSLSAAERGTVMHLVMQHVPLDSPVTTSSLSQLVEEMIQRELLTSQEAKAVDLEAIARFFDTPLGERLLNASFVRREVPFSYMLPAEELNMNQSEGALDGEEQVLIQGVVDCLFRDQEGLVMIDYKTDQLTGRFANMTEAEPILLQRYQVQLHLYRQAVEAIWGKKITERYLYFFDGDHLVAVPS